MKLIIIILCLAFLAGVFDSCMDIRRDNVPTFLSEWFGKWFIGGNDNYTLPIWGPYDFWHFSKSCLMATWVLIAVCSFYLGSKYPVSLWWEVSLGALVIYWIEGLTFFVFYHIIWRL